MASKWRHIAKFLQQIEREQYDSFDMPINSTRQLITALGQIFSFSYIRVISRHWSTLVTPVASFLFENKNKFGILEILSVSIIWHQKSKNPLIKNENPYLSLNKCLLRCFVKVMYDFWLRASWRRVFVRHRLTMNKRKPW